MKVHTCQISEEYFITPHEGAKKIWYARYKDEQNRPYYSHGSGFDSFEKALNFLIERSKSENIAIRVELDY